MKVESGEKSTEDSSVVHNNTDNSNSQASSIEETRYLTLIIFPYGSFHVISNDLKKFSSMTISDFLHFAVYEISVIQEQNKKN